MKKYKMVFISIAVKKDFWREHANMKKDMEYRLNDNVIIFDKINKMTREELEKAIKQKESEIKAKNK